ncbi:MAG: holin-associated N-acetylmuramidase [Paracoccaceae bacterium]
MKSIREIAEDIVAREGGFVNDPADPGGATNFGVTMGTMRALRHDTNLDGQIDVTDVKGLTRAEAVTIFLRHYFLRPGIALLPMSVQPALFDMYVNAGTNAVKVLQRLLARHGHPCADDGTIGPATIAAAKAMEPAALNNAYGIARRDYYYALADARPASRKYALRRDGGKGGWITRAEAFLPETLWLTDAQHHARTAAWKP